MRDWDRLRRVSPEAIGATSSPRLRGFPPQHHRFHALQAGKKARLPAGTALTFSHSAIGFVPWSSTSVGHPTKCFDVYQRRRCDFPGPHALRVLFIFPLARASHAATCRLAAIVDT